MARILVENDGTINHLPAGVTTPVELSLPVNISAVTGKRPSGVVYRKKLYMAGPWTHPVVVTEDYKAMLLPALSRAKERTRRIACMNNQKQLTLGCLMYSDDNVKGAVSPLLSDGDDDQSWLYPNYIRNATSFVCPSTQNFIRQTNMFRNALNEVTLYDLSYFALSKKNPGCSYELFGWWGYTYGSPKGTLPAARKTRSNSVTWVYNYRSDYYYCTSYVGQVAGASRCMLFLDGDGGYQGTRNNIPDAIDNHGTDGGMPSRW